MIRLLLALAQVVAAPQVRDSALSHRMYLDALDRMAAADPDSATVLLRAARDADLSSFPAHREYINRILDIGRGGLPALRRDYDTLPPSALHDCLRVYLSVPNYNITAVVPALKAMDRPGPAGECAATLLADAVRDMAPRKGLNDERLRYLTHALEGPQDAWWRWAEYASAMVTVSRYDEAAATLTRAVGRFSHSFEIIALQMRKATIQLQHGDTASAMALTRAVEVAVARDGRPGLRLRFLVLLIDVVGSANGEGNALDPILREGAALAKEHGAWDYEWRFRITLAVRMTGRGWSLQALPDYARSIAIADSVGGPRMRVMSYVRRGRALDHLGRQREGERDLIRAIAIGRGAAIPYWSAEAYHNLAHLHESAGRLPQASRAADRFIETIRPLTYSNLRMTAFLDAGEILWKAGRHAAARRMLDSMVRVVDFQQRNLYYAGEHLERIGELGRAKRYYEAAVANRENLALNLGGLVRVHRALGQLDSAAAAARQHDREPLGELDTPLLPAILAAQGDLEGATRIAAAWAEQRLEQGNIQGAAIAHLQWAGLLLQNDLPDTALAILGLVDSLTRIRSLVREEIETTRLRGLALSRLGREGDALTALRHAARLSRDHPTAATIVATHISLGEALTEAGRPQEALEVFDLAARQAHGTTGSLDEDFDRVRYRGQNMAPFDGAIRALFQLTPSAARVEQLLQWSQRRKAAALALAIQRTNGNTSGLHPLSLTALQARLAPNDALIDYLITDGATAAIVVTREGASLYRLPLTRDSLEHLVRELRRPLTVLLNGRVDLARAPFRLDLARELYRGLIAPLRSAIGGTEHLLVIPDGVLHYLPFAALVSSPTPQGRRDGYTMARYLVDDYESSYLPSAAFLPSRTLATARNTGPSARILALTHDAPGGDREVRSIAALWPTGGVQALEGEAATETAVGGNARNFDILHFAVHAIADDDDPLASYLQLVPDKSTDGLLHLSEIAEQSHTGQLVILSACETQMGRLYFGEGLMGLTRGFLATGAAAVVATQWPVGDATADLMAGFYRALASGQRPTTALRAAQLRLRREARTAHPFYWAAFGLHVGS